MNAKKLFLLSDGATGPAPGGDPSWNNVVLLTHLDTDDSSDRSGNNSIAFDGASLSTADFKFPTASMNITGSGGGLTVTGNASNFVFDVPSTIELWANWTNNSGPGSFAGGTILATSPNAAFANTYRGCFAIQFNRSNGAMVVQVYETSSRIAYSLDYMLPLNQWVHLALVRNLAGLWTFYADGISRSSFTPVQTLRSFGNSIKYGSFLPGVATVNTFGGYMDEIRITRGVARYTENFTPPEAPFPNFFGAG